MPSPLYTIDAILGLGARFYDSPDGTTYSELVDVAEFSPPEGEVEQVEVVNVATGNKERLNGVLDGGKLTFTQFYNATRYAHLLSRRGQKCWYKTQLPDLTTHSTDIFVGNLAKVWLDKIANSDKLVIKAEVACVGPETFTPGS